MVKKEKNYWINWVKKPFYSLDEPDKVDWALIIVLAVVVIFALTLSHALITN